MNPRNLQNFLSTLVEKKLHQSVMIWGPPGIGKSQTVAEVAREAKIELIDLRLSQLAPTDLRGLPVADHKERTARWYPPEFLPRGGKGILFLDELNMAPPAMQGIAQQLVLDRQVGSYTLPEGWHVWAAGNRIEDGASVFQMPSALQNRFVHLSVEATFDSFRPWALGHGIHERIVAFLAFRPQLLHKRDAAQPAWPSPRAWAAANTLYGAGLTIEPAVGKGAAGEFAAYEKVYASLPDLDAILEGKGKSIAFPSSPDARYASVIGLATRAKSQTGVKHGLDWVVEKSDAEWIQLFVYAKLDTAAVDNTMGILAATLSANAKVKKFLESYRRLVSQKMSRPAPIEEKGCEFDLPLLIFHLRNVSPFFGALALFSESVCTDQLETAATDGRRLLFNPAFMASHTLAEQLGILVHELLHAALRHVERRCGADPHLWNLAADIVVNGIIKETKGLVLPKSALLDEELAPYSVEEVYHVLLKRHGLPEKIVFIGNDLLAPEGGDGTSSGLGEHWNSAFAQAAVVARMGTAYGKLPAGIERAIAEAVDPPLDWRTLLWRHLIRTPVDFTAYDRRFIGEELYLDALDGESVRVAVCVDTSGSIGEEELGRFLNEIRAILSAYPATEVDLYCCDTRVEGPWKLDSPDCPMPKMLGGGGTAFEPFFDALETSPPDTAVYLTDGFGSFPSKAPHFSTLWVVTPGGLSRDKFPFGETARMLGE